MPRIGEPRRPLVALVGVAGTIVAIWCAVAAFNASTFVTAAAAVGERAFWSDLFFSELVNAWKWAVFTPIIVAAAERLPLRREHFLRDPLALIVTIVIFGAIRTVEHGTIVLMHYNTFIVIVIVGVTKLMDLYRDADADERNALALEEAIADAEAEHLRSQTQPSFLFATLNAIRDRVSSDPAAADAMLVALGEVLRRRLDQPAGKLVTLEEELVATERYVALLSVDFRFDVEEEVLDARVPPFALQTLLGIAVGEARPTSVLIRVERRPSVQRLMLEAHATPVDATPTSLASAREQLQQWFGSGDLRTSGSTMIAFVELRLQYANDAAYDPARTDRRG